jgi:hypothetical protein
MIQSASIRWTMVSLVLGLTSLLAGCAPAKNLLHRAHTACRNAELRSLCTPLPSPCYCGVTDMYGYYGTCWRPWSMEWQPPCFTCGPSPAGPPVPLEAVPLPPAQEQQLPPAPVGPVPPPSVQPIVPPPEREGRLPPPAAQPIGPLARYPLPLPAYGAP